MDDKDKTKGTMPTTYDGWNGVTEVLFPKMVRYLPFFGARVLDTCRGSLIVEDTSMPYTWWLVADNGGELQVSQINMESHMPGIPMTGWGKVVCAATMCYRVKFRMDGRPIDYNYEIPDSDLDGVFTAERRAHDRSLEGLRRAQDYSVRVNQEGLN